MADSLLFQTSIVFLGTLGINSAAVSLLCCFWHHLSWSFSAVITVAMSFGCSYSNILPDVSIGLEQTFE